MYNSFVLACNYALDKLSCVNIEGLPRCSPEKQLVFVRNHDRSVKSNSHQREPQVKPDVVLLRWERFAKLLKDSSVGVFTYPHSYAGNICTSKWDFGLSWRNVRSTVEMKVTGLPKLRDQKKSYAKDFGALHETAPHNLPGDNLQQGYMPENLPNFICESLSSREFLLLICPDR